METIKNIISEISINYKPKIRASERLKVTSSQDAETYFRSVWTNKMEYVEECYLLLLNRANKVLGFTKISAGGIAGTVVDAKLIFHAALKASACSIILAHNHPSGNLKPSQADIELTKKVAAAGKVMDITLLDHMVLTEDGYYSFADEGMI